jgi:hypothetical protein
MSWRRERFIRDVLQRLSRQRVALILQPGNVIVVEQAVMDQANGVPEALRTCHLRGWVEVVHEALPQAALGPNLELPRGWEGTSPVYRLTEAGWHIINRTHSWTIAVFVVAVATLIATVFGLVAQGVTVLPISGSS